MHHFLIARLRTTTRAPHYTVLCLNAILFFTSRTLSVSTTDHHKGATFNAYNIINSCGLPPEKATKVSKRLELTNPDGANAVIDILRNYGFSNTQLCTLVKKIPFVLLSKPEKTLFPKLKFFHSIGFSTTELPRFIIANTSILGLSLDKTIIPRYQTLKSVSQSDSKCVASTLKHDLWYFNRGMLVNDSVQNIEVLRQVGVPHRVISSFVTCFPSAVSIKLPRFLGAVEKVKEMGFDPLKSDFVVAVRVLSMLNEARWESKLKVFERWGWSKDISILAFKKDPMCMILSDKKIKKMLSFLMKDMGLSPEDIAIRPGVLKLSLEKRVIPRFAVIKILKARDLIKSGILISSYVTMSEKRFLDRYVTRFQENVPLLLDAYKNQKPK